MKIGLIDADNRHHGPDDFPNLALMKLAAWHKKQGDSVEWYEPLWSGHMNRVYISKVFKLNLDEIGDFLRYSPLGIYQGNYVAIIRATKTTCGVSGWMDDEVPHGDQVELYQVEPGESCPVCGNTAPDSQWCPECGASLTPDGPTKQQAIENAEKLLGVMKAEAVRMIKNSDIQETRKAWYHSHLGSIDFARQIGLITEERRQQLYKEFDKELKENRNDR